MQISPITSNFQNLIKANISKKTSKKNAMLLCTSGLAALLPAKDFLNKTKTDKLELSGHWETHQPIDSSDYYYQRWVKEEVLIIMRIMMIGEIVKMKMIKRKIIKYL